MLTRGRLDIMELDGKMVKMAVKLGSEDYLNAEQRRARAQKKLQILQ